MKLTISDKDTFVRVVMQDVPTTDYDEQAHKLVRKDIELHLPPKIREIMSDKSLTEYLTTQYVSFPHPLSAIYCVKPSGYKPLGAVLNELTGIAAKKAAQVAMYADLKANVRGIISSCSTLKQAKDRLPEFEKYLPEDRTGTGVENLPAISNVVAQLVQVGWPKDTPKSKKSSVKK